MKHKWREDGKKKGKNKRGKKDGKHGWSSRVKGKGEGIHESEEEVKERSEIWKDRVQAGRKRKK